MAAPSRSHCLADRIAIGVFCAPLTLLTGAAYGALLLRPLNPDPEWFTRLIGTGLAQFVGAVFALFLCATLWAITGKQRVDRWAILQLGRLVLITLVFAAVVVLCRGW